MGARHVIIAQEPVQFEFRLLADPAYVVTLASFDMAGWPHQDFPSIASVSVEDGAGGVLYSQANVLIYGSTQPQYAHFGFSGVTASELRIKYDSRTDGQGYVLDSDDVGIDNIRFSQTHGVGVLLGEESSAAAFRLSESVPHPDNVPLHALPARARASLGR